MPSGSEDSPLTTVTPSLREVLRHKTGAAHSRVDALFGSCDLAELSGYARFLRAQAAAWETLRPVLSDGSLMRADGLRADLDRLGVAVPAPLTVDRLPDAGSLGLNYVLEGSRLGSTVLLRDMQERAPELAGSAAYLRESADIDPWKRLSTLLQTDRDGSGIHETAIDDALFAFGLFESAWGATERA